jgi:MOSC domain-containing protein YiiM
VDPRSPPGRLLSVNVAKMRLIVLNGETTKTGIYKYPVEGRVLLADNQVGPDRQADYEVHGGYDKAAYAYADEDYRWWAGELGRELEPGLFGENLTTGGIDVSGALIGERWRIGDALVEVAEPRQPCSKFSHRMGDPRWVKRFAKALRPGAYLRIIESGEIGAGDPIEVVSRPAHAATIELMSRVALGEREPIPQLLAAKALSAQWRRWAENRLADAHGA